MNKMFILCWGSIHDDQPFQMVHRRYYSSQRLALEAMYRLILADTRGESFIDKDQDGNHLINIVEYEMDNLIFEEDD